jgi:hypothetical protein
VRSSGCGLKDIASYYISYSLIVSYEVLGQLHLMIDTSPILNLMESSKQNHSNPRNMADGFDWNIPGLNKHHFTAFANLLALRNGGQVELVSLGDGVHDENEPDDSSDTVSINTSSPHQISSSDNNRLKREFLDSLAEFAANKKGGKSVSCCILREAEEAVTIWIARNEGFQPQDNPFF